MILRCLCGGWGPVGRGRTGEGGEPDSELLSPWDMRCGGGWKRPCMPWPPLLPTGMLAFGGTALSAAAKGGEPPPRMEMALLPVVVSGAEFMRAFGPFGGLNGTD